ncbi:hypothetical protein ACWD4V_30850 [Streptomyces tsukubensis]|uniref:hypothetical protein n=1 Tax=Streptomyces tsukubensis TaxID=83656 RepID=UPI003687004A
MNTLKPRIPAFLPWAGAALFGAAVGLGGWWLTVWARLHCLADQDAGGNLELNVLLLLVPGMGVLAALAALRIGRLLTRSAPTAVRRVTPVLLIAVMTVLPVWWVFADRGTLDGYPSHSDACPSSNIPPQWPDWIPA